MDPGETSAHPDQMSLLNRLVLLDIIKLGVHPFGKRRHLFFQPVVPGAKMEGVNKVKYQHAETH